MIDHSDLPLPVIGQRICDGCVKKKGEEGSKKDKMDKKTGRSRVGRGKIEFERGKKKKERKRKRNGGLKRVVSSPWRTDSIPNVLPV